MIDAAIVIQARMGSTRLPGKTLKEVLGKPLLFYLIERLKKSKNASRIILAIPKKDQALMDFAEKHKIIAVAGPEEDVLSRFGKVASEYPSDAIVRITADCPLMDPLIIDAMIAKFEGLDYLSNTLIRTFPRGLDVEVFSKKALENALKEAEKPEEREHVTPYFYRHPEKFQLENFLYKTDESRYRWTVDTKEDFELVKKIIEALYPKKPHFDLEDMLALSKKHPEWDKINQHVLQKDL